MSLIIPYDELYTHLTFEENAIALEKVKKITTANQLRASGFTEEEIQFMQSLVREYGKK